LSYSYFRALGRADMHLQTLTEAHRLASQALNRHPVNHEHSERLAQTIVNFFDRGIRDPGVLSTLAVNRENAMEEKKLKAVRRNARQARIARQLARTDKRQDSQTQSSIRE
jgi:hypothetical protein